MAPRPLSLLVLFVLSVLSALCLGLLPALPAWSAPTDPVTISLPNDADGAMFVPEGPTVDELPGNYLLEEFLASGTGTVYTYNEVPVPGEIVPLTPGVPWATRFIVRRPVDPADFSGTVIIEWLNSTAGFDTSPVWHASAEHFLRGGWIYIGVTNSSQSTDHLVAGCLLLGVLPPATCGTRYAGLGFPENGVAFEAVSQIAHLLKTAAAPNPLFPDYPVQRIYHAGQSQQGGSMVTYATSFHFAANDAYFVQAAGRARPINFQTPCEDAGAPAYPACTPTLQGADRLVATDLPVPVFRVQTETDMEGVLSDNTRQSDSPSFRYYETAGTAHVTVHKDALIIPAGLFGDDPIFLEEACAEQVNTLRDGPIRGMYLYNAMWDNLHQQVLSGTPPPSAPLLATTPANEVARDAWGNALGGIRLPNLDLPKATYGPRNALNPDLNPLLAPLGNLFCRLSGEVLPFDEATLALLHPDNVDFVNQFNQKLDELVAGRFLLPVDADELKLFVETKEQRKCSDGLHKNLALVASKQAKTNRLCLRDAAKGKLPAGQTADTCLGLDGKGIVDRALDKTTTMATRDCATAPDFGADDPDSVNAAGVRAPLDSLTALFGADLDGTLVPAADKLASKCQAEVAKAAGKCQDKLLRGFASCAKKGAKKASVHDALTLAECVGDDPKGAIDRLCNEKLVVKLDKRCAGADLAALFPGRCGSAASLAEFEACVGREALCRGCLAINAGAGIDHDCDVLDDGLLNATCPFE